METDYERRLVPASLESLTGLERNKVYRMLHLLVSPSPEGYEVNGYFCTGVPCGSSWFQNTKLPELRFRALLTQDGTQQLELVRA
jgi:hypothetical protein